MKVLTTDQLRDLCRKARPHTTANRTLAPSQFGALDPYGYHVLSQVMLVDRGRQPSLVRVSALLKVSHDAAPAHAYLDVRTCDFLELCDAEGVLKAFEEADETDELTPLPADVDEQTLARAFTESMHNAVENGYEEALRSSNAEQIACEICDYDATFEHVDWQRLMPHAQAWLDAPRASANPSAHAKSEETK